MIRTILLISILSPVLIAACDVNASSISPTASTDEFRQQETEPLFAGTYTNEPGNCDNVRFDFDESGFTTHLPGEVPKTVDFNSYLTMENRDTIKYGKYSDIFLYPNEKQYFMVIVSEYEPDKLQNTFMMAHYSHDTKISPNGIDSVVKSKPFLTGVMYLCEL